MMKKKLIILLIILGFVLFFCKKNIPMKKELSKHNGQVIFSLNNTLEKIATNIGAVYIIMHANDIDESSIAVK